MARSLRFGSRACNSNALFGLAFATASPHGLTSLHTANSQAHSSKGTQSRDVQARPTLPRLVGTRFQVLFHSAPAVLFTIPSRYYPLSVTREYLGLAGGPARFTRISRAPCYLGDEQASRTDFSYGGLTLYAGPFACPSPIHTVSDSPSRRQTTEAHSHNPACATPAGYHTHTVWPHPVSLATTPGITVVSLPEGTEMFHPSFPPHCLCVQQRVTAHDDCRVSPFGHPRIKAQLAAPRGLSRPLTSFIGSWCQGIHRAPLKTWPQMLASTV